VLARTRGGDEVVSVPPEQVDYMDVNPTQLVSVATALTLSGLWALRSYLRRTRAPDREPRS